MTFLIINAGSSSIKFKIFDEAFSIHLHGQLERIGSTEPLLRIETLSAKEEQTLTITDHKEGMIAILDAIDTLEMSHDLCAIGHRVVHGGEEYSDSVIIDDSVIKNIESFSKLAPLHNPVNLACITACRTKYPSLLQVASFDTAFHQTIPATNYRYALPAELYTDYGIRKYGFHGLSHRYVSETAASLLSSHEKPSQRMIICHLGNGSSITAVKNGKSINTSMGFTPLEGIPMGTRCGSLDPGIVPYVQETLSYSSEQISSLLNTKSGLKGLSGHSDMRDIHDGYKTNSMDKLAFDLLVNRIAEYIGAYMSSLQGCDAIVFTGGIGENAFYLRKAVIERLDWAGVSIDDDANTKNKTTFISEQHSRITVLRIQTDEEQMIAQDTKRLIK